MNKYSSTTNCTKASTRFKIMVVGQRGVGKTSFLMRYDRGIFCKTYAITIGIESFQKEIIINHERICLQLWDTIGQEGCSSILRSFYIRACCIIIVYSEPQLLERALESYIGKVGQYSSRKVFIAVVRTKNDLRKKNSEEERLLEEYMKSNRIHFWMDVSSKQGTNVEKFFEQLSIALLLRYEDDFGFRSLVHSKKPGSIILSKISVQKMKKKKKGNCCKP